jgi:hypothetical protein
MRVFCFSMVEEVRRLLGRGGAWVKADPSDPSDPSDKTTISRDQWWRWLVAVVVGGGIYGASIGLWRAPEQAVWVAVKMPLLILLTLGVNGVFTFSFVSAARRCA